jgi:hypothetical protein
MLYQCEGRENTASRESPRNCALWGSSRHLRPISPTTDETKKIIVVIKKMIFANPTCPGDTSKPSTPRLHVEANWRQVRGKL